MNFSSPIDDVSLAKALAQGAGELLRALQQTSALEARALGDEGDRSANEYLLAALKRMRPLDAVLSEESHDDFSRINARRVWIIDPLDGTREFRERRDDWAVHVALIEACAVTAAAVAIPARGEVLASAENDDSLKPLSRTGKEIERRIVISRSRPPEFAPRIASALNAQIMQVGSAGAKAMMVVRGDALAYVHEGGMNEWDAAAPVGVALAHGLHVSDLRGAPIMFNQRDVVLREGLVICVREVAPAIFDGIQRAPAL